MIIDKQTIITKDLPNRKLLVIREFDASLDKVWKSWTQSELLDKWWAPKPWKAKTKTMDFREGGFWFYYMEGPDGTKTYARVDFKTIVPNKFFTALDSFCDETGKDNPDFPHMHWKNLFSETGTGAKVEVEITFPTIADLEKIIEMGFEEGFTEALKNLDELLEG